MTVNKVDREHSSVIISFEFVVEWDAWYFTSNASPDSDPVKFSLQSFDGETLEGKK